MPIILASSALTRASACYLVIDMTAPLAQMQLPTLARSAVIYTFRITGLDTTSGAGCSVASDFTLLDFFFMIVNLVLHV